MRSRTRPRAREVAHVGRPTSPRSADRSDPPVRPGGRVRSDVSGRLRLGGDLGLGRAHVLVLPLENGHDDGASGHGRLDRREPPTARRPSRRSRATSDSVRGAALTGAPATPDRVSSTVGAGVVSSAARTARAISMEALPPGSIVPERMFGLPLGPLGLYHGDLRRPLCHGRRGVRRGGSAPSPREPRVARGTASGTTSRRSGWRRSSAGSRSSSPSARASPPSRAGTLGARRPPRPFRPRVSRRVHAAALAEERRDARARRRTLQPEDRRRARLLWLAVSLAAGVSEEITYRGVFFLLLHRVTGSVLAAALLAAAAFGLAHVVQGRESVLVIFGIALLAQTLVLVTGTLLVAMAVHVAYDVPAGPVYGRLARRRDASTWRWPSRRARRSVLRSLEDRRVLRLESLAREPGAHCRATRRPSSAAETIPPAKPAPSPAGKSPRTDGLSHRPSRSMRTGEDVRDSGARRTASSEMKPGILRSNARSPSASASRYGSGRMPSNGAGVTHGPYVVFGSGRGEIGRSRLFRSP